MIEKNEYQTDPAQQGEEERQQATTMLVTRSLFGGVLMGLANLVPGISGGTMLLAAGIYPAFIKALSELTRFRFRWRSLLVLGCVVAAAGIGILLLAGTLKDLVVHHRWIMYSLFIGLTLGGVPIVWRLAKPATPGLYVAGSIAFIMMAGLVYLQETEVVGQGGSGFLGLVFAGLAGASAMILPGLSGGYLLLLLGEYVPILKGIDQFKDALSARDFTAAMDPALNVVLPVGIGVVVGVVAVGNLLEWMLRHYRKITLGILLGLLFGSTIGLYPFREGVQPKIGDTFKAQVVTEKSLAEIEPEDYPNRMFRPSAIQVVESLALIGLGFAITLGVAKIGGQESKEDNSADDQAES